MISQPRCSDSEMFLNCDKITIGCHPSRLMSQLILKDSIDSEDTQAVLNSYIIFISNVSLSQ